MKDETIRVLLVEGDPGDAQRIREMLSEATGILFEVECVDCLSTGLERLAQGNIDVTLVGLDLREGHGIDAVEKLRDCAPHVPVLALTGVRDETIGLEVIKKGAQDYLVKGELGVAGLVLALRYAIERKRVEEDLSGEKAKLEGLLSSVGFLIAAMDEDYNILFMSEEFVEQYGDRVGEKCYQVFCGLDEPCGVNCAVDEVIKRGKEIFEYSHSETEDRRTGRVRGEAAKADLGRILETVARPFLYQGKRCVLEVSRDITERKSLEEQLRHAHKMEAVGRLAGGIAHDFNNLLMVINGYSEFVLNELREGDPLRKDVEEIKRAGERAAALTRQLLAFSRKHMLQPEVLDLNSVVADMEKMLSRLIGEHIDLTTLMAPDLGRVKLDPGMVEQVIVNLVLNARDAMPNGGKLTIETANVNLDKNYVCAHLGVTPGRYVMLAVSDTGMGMDEETQSRIFEPFFTTKEDSKGTGLGLATVYGIVKQSGGFIWVHSEPGRGARFEVYFPRIQAEAAESPKREVDADTDALRGSERVLVVEDEESVRTLVRRTLESKGYAVLVASNGREALQVFKECKDPIHLVITDMVMPGMSGLDLVKQLGDSFPKTKVIYISGYPDHSLGRDGLVEPGTNFLYKPIAPHTLLHKVRQVLDAPEPEQD